MLRPFGKWTAIAGNTVRGLAPGTFEVRYAATASEMASQVQKVAITTGGVGDLTTPSSKLSLLNRKDPIAYIAGRTRTQAAPDADITRAETIVMVNRILGRSVSADTAVKGCKTFSDVPTGAWYYWDIVEASNGHSFGMDSSTEKWTALG